MILKLTTPYNPGDADPGVTYQYLHIDVIVYNSTVFNGTVVYDFGNLDANSVYTVGKGSPRLDKTTTEDEFLSFATAMSAPGEPAMITTQRLAYEFLRDKRGYAGTVDPALPKDPPVPGAGGPPPDQASSAQQPPVSTNSSQSSSTSSNTSTNTGSSTSTDSSGGSASSTGSGGSTGGT